MLSRVPQVVLSLIAYHQYIIVSPWDQYVAKFRHFLWWLLCSVVIFWWLGCGRLLWWFGSCSWWTRVVAFGDFLGAVDSSVASSLVLGGFDKTSSSCELFCKPSFGYYFWCWEVALEGVVDSLYNFGSSFGLGGLGNSRGLLWSGCRHVYFSLV